MVLQGRHPQGVVAKPPPRTCYCPDCTPIREELEALRDVLRNVQATAGHSLVNVKRIRSRRDHQAEYARTARTADGRAAKRARDARYRERNRDKLRDRAAERRRLNPGRNYSGKPSPEAIKRARRRNKQLNAESRDNATRFGQQWTGPEMEIAARTDLPVPELARMLGRTIASVYGMRSALARDPKIIQVAGLPERAA